MGEWSVHFTAGGYLNHLNHTPSPRAVTVLFVSRGRSTCVLSEMLRSTPLLGIMEAAAKAAVRPKTGAKSLLVWRYLDDRSHGVHAGPKLDEFLLGLENMTCW